jgi:hypothetical protein
MHLNNYIIFILIIIVILLIFIIDYFCIYEHFDNEIKTSTCKLYTTTKFTNSKYVNMGQIELIGELNKKDKNYDNILEIYNYKKKTNFKLNFYDLNNLSEIKNKNDKDYKSKILNSTSDLNGDPFTWTLCNFNDNIERNIIDKNNTFNIINNNLSFRTLNTEKIKKTVCEKDNKKYFFNMSSKDTVSNEEIFYKIQCKVNDDNTLNVLLSGITMVNYNINTLQFEEIVDNDINLMKLFTISYNNKSIYFLPYKNTYEMIFYKFNENICGDYYKIDTFNGFFDLSMLGIKNITISTENSGLNLNNENDIYGLLSSSVNMIDSKKIILNEIDNYNTKLSTDKILEYDLCKKNKFTNSILINLEIAKSRKDNTNLKKTVLNLEKQIKDINNFLRLLKNPDSNVKDIYNKENIVISHCKYNLDNNRDLKSVYKNFNSCKNTFEKLKEQKNIEKKEFDNLTNQLDKITEFNNFIINNKRNLLEINNQYSAPVEYKLNKYKDEIIGYCSIDNYSGLTIQDIKTKTNKLSEIVGNSEIKNEIFNNLKNTIINNNLLKYVSSDNAIYILYSKY